MSDDGYTRITLRIPTPLDERLTESAKATSKSKNAEIVERLDMSFNRSDDKIVNDLAKTLSKMEERVSYSDSVAISYIKTAQILAKSVLLLRDGISDGALAPSMARFLEGTASMAEFVSESSIDITESQLSQVRALMQKYAEDGVPDYVISRDPIKP
ncbi:hypothetical protein [Chromobacterium subtsugae]|uniref:hypothetical protein n=1 Tax=Chromobacterium subtsugae TaxID=251747 RepID=UPI0007F92AF0|nr:hypothetical protein [Chromobacterium subtsugae]OBU85871.1 hypothetical protein MY55_13670 [Chromobacterium subtsugae]